MQAVAELAPNCGVITAACAALDLSRASFHRHQAAATRPPVPVRPRPKPARALAANERQTVISLLRSEPYIDLAPAEVYALRNPLIFDSRLGRSNFESSDGDLNVAFSMPGSRKMRGAPSVTAAGGTPVNVSNGS